MVRWSLRQRNQSRRFVDGGRQTHLESMSLRGMLCAMLARALVWSEECIMSTRSNNRLGRGRPNEYLRPRMGKTDSGVPLDAVSVVVS